MYWTGFVSYRESAFPCFRVHFTIHLSVPLGDCAFVFGALYSGTSVARTLEASLPRLFELVFESRGKIP